VISFLVMAQDETTQAIWTALSTVIDPELGLDIVTLGLVYEIVVEDGVAQITHTLTTPGCPMERVITDGVRGATLQVEGITRVDTHIVWDPAWHPGMIAQDAFPGNQ
jgi:metal-sulfur cluster biosynthetic enzyme